MDALRIGATLAVARWVNITNSPKSVGKHTHYHRATARVAPTRKVSVTQINDHFSYRFIEKLRTSRGNPAFP